VYHHPENEKNTKTSASAGTKSWVMNLEEERSFHSSFARGGRKSFSRWFHEEGSHVHVLTEVLPKKKIYFSSN
jgi:hypothetical protein